MRTGKIVMTIGVAIKNATSWTFKKQVQESLEKFISKDWGDISENDKQTNDLNVQSGTGSLMGAYETCLGRIWIMTEHDRSVTTILFPDEY